MCTISFYFLFSWRQEPLTMQGCQREWASSVKLQKYQVHIFIFFFYFTLLAIFEIFVTYAAPLVSTIKTEFILKNSFGQIFHFINFRFHKNPDQAMLDAGAIIENRPCSGGQAHTLSSPKYRPLIPPGFCQIN